MWSLKNLCVVFFCVYQKRLVKTNIHQTRLVKKWGGVWTDVDGGGGVGYRPDVQKCQFVCVSESVSESNTPPPLKLPGRNFFAIQTSVERGEGVFKTNNVWQGKGVLKIHFLVGRLRCMTPPRSLFNKALGSQSLIINFREGGTKNAKKILFKFLVS